MRNLSILLLVMLIGVLPACARQSPINDVLNAHVEASGGADAWANVSSRHMKGEVLVDTQIGPLVLDIETWNVFPGYSLIRQTTVSAPPEIGSLDQTIFLSPDGGWIDSPQVGGRQDLEALPPQMQAGLAAQRRGLNAASDEIAMLSPGADSVLTLGEPDVVKGAPVHVIEVGGDTPTKRFYSTESGLLVAVEMPGAMGGQGRQYLSDYRDVAGFKVPFFIEIDLGEMTQSIKFSVVEMNTGMTIEDLTAMSEAK